MTRAKHFAGALVLLAACGGADAPSEAPDAGLGEASVQIGGNEPETPIQVAFHAADGALLGSSETDADGFATGPMEPGGMITARIVEPGFGSFLDTLVGVQPGDSIDWDTRDAPPSVPPGSIAVTLPGPVEDAVRYVVSSSCGDKPIEHAVGGPALVIGVSSRCLATGDPDVVAVAYDALGEALAISSAIDVADVASDPAITLPAWSSEPIDTTVAISGMTGDVFVQVRCMAGQVVASSSNATVTAVDGIATFPTAGVAACDRVGVDYWQTIGDGSERGYVERLGVAPISIAADDRLTSIDEVVSATDPAAGDLLTVTLGTSGVRPNLVWAWIGTSDATTKGWYVAMSGDTTTVPFPELPPEMDGSIPPLDALTLVYASSCSSLTWDQRRLEGHRSSMDDCLGAAGDWLERGLAVE